MRAIDRRTFATLMFGGAVALRSGRAEAQQVTLKVADSFPPNHNIANFGTKWWMQRVEELTGGKVKFEYYGAEQLGKLRDLLALAQRGVADIVYVPPNFNEGQMPLSSVHNLPNLFETSYVGSVAFLDTVMNTPILQQDFLRNGVRPLWGVMTLPYNVFTRNKPIWKVEDLAGLKLKTAGGYQNDAVRLLGGVPIDLPSPETYQAVQLGTVDGAIFPTSAAKSYRMHEVAKYYTVGFNITVFYAPYAMSLRRWDRLSPDIQQAFDTANREVTVRMSRNFDQTEQELIEGYRKAGVEIIQLDPAEREKVNQRLAPMFDTWLKNMRDKGLDGETVLKYFRDAIARVQA